MNVIFVSNCRDRAAKRTQRILDSYAIRIAPRTWASPVTEQGLQGIRQALAAEASRRSAVACYRARGTRDMRLLWVVGSHKRFGAEGQFAIGVRTSTRPTPAWIRLGALVVHIGGLGHDWGKGTQLFRESWQATCRFQTRFVTSGCQHGCLTRFCSMFRNHSKRKRPGIRPQNVRLTAVSAPSMGERRRDHNH